MDERVEMTVRLRLFRWMEEVLQVPKHRRLIEEYEKDEVVPYFKTEPRAEQTHLEGNRLVLTCLAEGSWPLSFRWLFNGSQLTQYSPVYRFVIPSLDRSHAGSYQCVVRNRAGALMQRPTEIHVAYMGKFDGGRRRQGVWQGQAAVLTPPHIPSYPQPQVTWFHEGQKISPSARISSQEGTETPPFSLHSAVTMENQLVVLATAAADAGRYRVQAVNERNGENKTSQELELDVEDASSPADPVAPEIVVAPRNMSVRFGTEGVTLECVANARPIDLLTLEWWRGSRKVMEGVSSWGRRLSLPTLTSVHGGSYECRALLRGSRVPSASAFAHLTITEQPVFIQEPEGHTVGEVESVVELPCKAIGVPPPKLTWFKDGDRLLIQRDPRVSLTPNGGLRIRALEPGDTGIFQCWAQNMAGMTQSYTHLSVTSVAASIMRGPADAVVIARTIVELPCEAHGAPRPSVAWERDGVVLVSGSMQTPRYVLLETGGLRIDPALRSDSGTFTCIVANSQGQDQATATLTVWERTRISIPPIDQSVIKDATVTFLCGVIHDPSVTVRFSWEKDGKRLEFATGSRRSLTSENALVISQAWSGDRGVYTCHAASAGGNASHNARLDVWERPSEPQDVRATQAKGRVVALTWVQPFDGNTELTGYQVEVSENESPWRMLPLNVNPDVTRVAVHDLVPGWTYQFRLQAVNKVGYGPNSQATERIFLPEESPGEPPQHLFIHEILSTSLDVRWLPPPYRYRHGKIRGYLIRYQPVGLSGEFQVQNVSGGDKTSFILVDLLQWAAYEVAVAAYTAIGPGPYSPSSTSWTLQGAPRVPPRDVKAEVISSTSIKLSWLPPSPDTIPGIILGYKLLSWPTSSTDAVETVTIAPGNTESRVSGELKGLRKFTAYDTAVVCFTWPGDGPPSPSIRLRTLEDRPGPVAQLNFSYVLDTSVRVSWLPPFEANGFIVGYHVSWEQPGQPGSLKNRMLPSSARDLIITGLSPLIIYAITVSAQTVIGQGPPSSATISSGVPPELPGAPTNLAISNIGPHSVILQFRAGYGGKTSVSRWLVEAEVKHEEETEGWQQVFELAGGPDARSIEVPGLAPFTHYRFRMRQTNIVGTSPASHPSRHVQTLQAPPYMAPANLSVHASGKNSLLLRWAPLPESSYNALPDTVGYRLQYRHLRAVNRRPDVAEMTWVSIALAGKVSQSNELGGLQKSGSTEVRRETRKPVGKKKSTKIEVQWVVVTDRLERELKLEGLQPWSLYELRIQAFNSISAGPWGQPVRGRTREDVPSAGPENISVVATGPHTLLVTWGAIPEGSKNGWILGYKVLTSNPAEPVPPLDSVATAAQESIVNVSGLQAATLYKLTVLAYTQVGDGVPTDPAVTCHTMEDLPGRPGAVWFPEVSSHAVRLAWQPPPQPNGQILGYRASLLANGSGSNPERTWELGSDVKQVRAAGLAPETRYTFLLAAQTSRGWGSPAEVVIITTQHRGRPAPPGRPWADAKTLGPRTLLLKWAAGAGGFAPVRYYILHSQKMSAGVWQPLASTLPPQPTEFLVNWLEPFTDYLFRLTAINDVGESEPSETSQTVTTLQDVPSKPPTLLAVRPVSPTSLLLQWQRAYLLVTVENADSKKPTSATATSSLSQSTIESTFAPPPPAGSMNGLLLGYSLRYQQRPSPQEPNPIPGPIIQLTSDPQPPPLAPTMLKTVNDSSLTEYKLQGLERYRHYEVRLSVYNSAGEGPPSDPWEVYVGEALPTAPPRGLHLLSATATQLHLSWQPPQKNNGENDILAYKVYCRKAGSAASSEEKTVRLLKNNVRLGSLLSFTSYLVSVVTVNSAGEGPRSQALQARTLQAAPSAPAYLHFTKMTSSSVNVTWGMPIQPNGLITGFRVIYQPTSPVNGISKIVTVDVPGSSRKWLLIKDLTEGETYMVGVCARTLAYGPEISGNITAGPAHGAPGPPAEPWVQLDEETVTVHWVEGDPGNSPVSGYIIEARASDEGLWELVARNLPASAQSHTIPLLQFHSDTSYAFRVFARNAHGLGSPSPPSPAISARVHMGFYEEWWFLVVVALCSFGFVVLLVFGLLARGQNRKYARKSDSGNTPRMGAEELTSLDGGFPALEMESRRLPIKSGLSIKPGLSFKPPLSIKPGLQRRNGTQPRSPPRPSPGTLHYSDEELMPYEVTREAEPPPDLTESQQVKDEDFPPDIAKEQPHSFVNHYISDPSYYHSWNRKPKVFSHSEDQAQLVVAAGVGQALQRGLYVCTANGRPPDAPGPPTGLSSFV